MEVVECFGGVLTCYLSEDGFSTWVSVYEFCGIVDFAVNDEPQGILRVVLRDLVPSEYFVRHCKNNRNVYKRRYFGKKKQDNKRKVIVSKGSSKISWNMYTCDSVAID